VVTHIEMSEGAEPKSEAVVRKGLMKYLRDEDVLISGMRIHDHEFGDVEIDHLVLMPDKGAAFIETKGGHVSYAQGNWWTTGKDGTHRTDPPGQAKRGLYAFRRFLDHHPEWTKGKLAGDWFLAFPFTDVGDTEFMGPQGRRETIFGRGEEDEMASRIWEILAKRHLVLPSHGWVEEIVDIVLAMKDVPITLKERVTQRLEHIEQLTEQQSAMLRMWRNNRFVEVVGGAGSGKTWLAMEQARQWGAAGLSVAFLTYTKGVGEAVKKAFEDRPDKETPPFIGTFHALGYHWGVFPDPDRSGEPDYWTVELPVEYLKVATSLPPGQKFDAVIVDEAQDFEDSWWDVVLASMKDPESFRLAIFRDDGQAVFGDKRGRPDLPFAVFDLDSNLRNGRQVVEAFAPLTSRKMDVVGGEGSPTRMIFAEPEDVITAADDAVSDMVGPEGWLPEHVALLTTKSRHPEHAYRQDADKDAYWQELWSTNDIFYGTVAGFKGLERPAIVIAVNGFHPHADPKDVLYTAISRAIDLAVLVGSREELESVLGAKHLRRLERRQK